MLINKTENRLLEAIQFARKIGKLDSLVKNLKYLRDYSDKETRCLLFRDWAPYSFSFVVQIRKNGDWVRWFNGGLIFHGYDGGSGGAPSFAVTLNPTDGWEIHT